MRLARCVGEEKEDGISLGEKMINTLSTMCFFIVDRSSKYKLLREDASTRTNIVHLA